MTRPDDRPRLTPRAIMRRPPGEADAGDRRAEAVARLAEPAVDAKLALGRAAVAEAADVAEPQFAAAGDADPQVCMILDRACGGADRQLPGHAEVNHERAGVQV